MRGIDTNALLRIAVLDDEVQSVVASRFASRLARQNESLFVTSIGLCEFVWVLSTHYRFQKSEIVSAVDDLLSLDLVALEYPEEFRKAVELYREGPADFADYLIGIISSQAGCRDTVTFDRKLGSETGFTRLG